MVDHQLFRILGNYIFQQKSLSDIVSDYQKDEGAKNDDRGKLLYRYLSDELKARRKDRDFLIEVIVDYWFDSKLKSLDDLVKYLHDEM